MVDVGEIGIIVDEIEYYHTHAQEIFYLPSGASEIKSASSIVVGCPYKLKFFDSIEEAVKTSQELNPGLLTKEGLARFLTNQNEKIRELTKTIIESIV